MCSRPKKLHHRAGRPSAPRRMPTGTSTGRLAASTSSRQIGSFYEQPEPEDDQKTLELEWRIQELERRAEEESKAQETADEQLRLMEKSYEMASRYLPQDGGGAKSVPVTETEERTVSPVTQVAEQVVSDGKEAEIRLLEPVDVGGMYVPANTVLTATARINGERMELTVSSIAYKGTVVPVELEVYDPSGMKGISVPGSQELTALKEMAANMGSTMGSSINISTNAGTWDAARYRGCRNTSPRSSAPSR